MKIETNKDKLLKVAVLGEIISPGARGYRPTWDGAPKLSVGMAGIKYNLKVGDSCFGWANGDHVEPGVTIQGKERDSPSDCAIALLACIGNEAKVVSGEAKGDKGVFTGRHAGSDEIVWFDDPTLEELTIGDKVQVKAHGVGLKIKGFDDVRVNKCAPRLLEAIGIEIVDGKLRVPVTAEVPGFLMGSGIGWSTILENVDYDIQNNDPKAIEKYELDKLRLGDLVLLKDQLCTSGRGYWKGAMTVGVIIHGSSDYSGHGPGVNPILSTKDGRLETYIDPNANTALYLGLRDKLP